MTKPTKAARTPAPIKAVAATPPAGPRDYTSATINFETSVLAAAKAEQRGKSRQFRSVSALVNFHMAQILGVA
jgi:hypothetical protein